MNAHLPDEQKELIDRYLDGELDEAEFGEFKAMLRDSPAARDSYSKAVKMDTLLREIAGRRDTFVKATPEPARRRSVWWKIGAVAAGLLGLAFIVSLLNRGGEAEIGKISEAAWVSESLESGQILKSGDQIELAAGSVEVRFRSGALTRIHGPARFEVTSSNGGFLHFGQTHSRADSPSSQGFSIRTASANFIDQGTEFLTTARQDGFSQMHVTSGAVDAEVNGFARQRFEKGSGLGIEPGERPVMIRIESGDGTPAFHFPTIPPPSASDWADTSHRMSTVELISEDDQGRVPHQKSGPPETLTDGRGQSWQDRPDESPYFTNGATGMILIDLGADVPVSKVHSYSWHLNDKHPDMRPWAVQRYTLWGAAGERPDAVPSERAPGGWTRIARVDTDAFFRVEEEPDRPAQQACAIHSSAPSLGEFRYLVFQVIPTPMSDGKPVRHTFFGEIDVFTMAHPAKPDRHTNEKN